VRLPIVNLGNVGNGLHSGFSLLETWIGARANAEQLFFSEMRSKVAGIPLLDAGMQLAEAIAKQQSDLAHLLIDLIDLLERAVAARGLADVDGARLTHAGERAVATRGLADVDAARPPYAGERAVATRGLADMDAARPPYAGERAAEGYAHTADLRSDAAQRALVLRLAIPQGTLAVAVPLRLRNHRQSVERVSLSAVAPSAPGIAAIPSQLIRFDPEALAIPPLSEGSVQLHLRLGSGFVQPGEYWSEIVIDGTETKRVPLALQIRPDPQSGGSQPLPLVHDRST
jgi:hypothetical protein